MNHLRRELAPLTARAWQLLEETATQALRPALAARRLVEVTGPHGWTHSAASLGRTTLLAVEPTAGVRARLRVVQPLVELRAGFRVRFEVLEDAERGDEGADLGELEGAARQLALAENLCVFHGYDQAGITGLAQASPHEPIALGDNRDVYPRQVARAVATLRRAGVDGPYALALGPDAYTGVVETAEHGAGVLLLDHLRQILGGPVVWAPGVEGGVVVSTRGGDFRLELGTDLSLGYARHDEEAVHLYLEESCTFTVTGPEAAVALSA